MRKVIKLKRLRIFLYILFIINVLFLFKLSGQENLDELIARKSRQVSANWGWQYLEDSNNHYYWQSEAVMYYDIQTGHEVWRMTSTPDIINYYHNDIGVTPWSADGKRIAFFSDRNTGAFSREYMIWMIVNTDGNYLRPIPNAPSREKDHTEYFHWSPQIPDVYSEFWSKAFRGMGKLI